MLWEQIRLGLQLILAGLLAGGLEGCHRDRRAIISRAAAIYRHRVEQIMQAVHKRPQVVHNLGLLYKLQALQSSGPEDLPHLDFVGRELVANDFAIAGDAEDAEKDALEHAADTVRLAAQHT